MGDFEEVERLQAGIRTWLVRTARSGRHELRGISAPAVLPPLCAAAFGPAGGSDRAGRFVGTVFVADGLEADCFVPDCFEADCFVPDCFVPGDVA